MRLCLALSQPPPRAEHIFDKQAIVAEGDQIPDWVCDLAARRTKARTKPNVRHVGWIVKGQRVVQNQVVNDLKPVRCDHECFVFQVVSEFLRLEKRYAVKGLGHLYIYKFQQLVLGLRQHWAVVNYLTEAIC